MIVGTVTLTRAQVAAVYGTARKLPSEIVIVQREQQQIMVDHPPSGRQWLITAAGKAERVDGR